MWKSNFCTVFSKIIKHISAGWCWTSVVVMFNISKANETCRVLNCNESQSNADTASLGGLRKLLPAADCIWRWSKKISSRNIWSVWPGRSMLNVWHQDSSFSQGRSFPSPIHGTWILPLGRMSRSSSSNLPKPFHTHHTHKILAVFSQISFWRDQPPLFLFVSIYLFVCHSLSKRIQKSMSNKSAWSNIISALCLVQPGQETTRRHDRTELAVWLNQKELKPLWLLFWALSIAGFLY